MGASASGGTMSQKGRSRAGCVAGCAILGLATLGAVSALFWWGTRPGRESRWAHEQLRAGMTLPELGRVLARCHDWTCVLRPPSQDDERRVHLSRREGRVLYFGEPGDAWTPPSAVLDEKGAALLGQGMGPGEWSAHVQFVGLLMVYELELTFDAEHRVRSYGAVRRRVPHG